MAATAVQPEPSPFCRLCTTIEAGRLEDVRKQIHADQDMCRCETRVPVYRVIKLYQSFLRQSRTDSMAKALVWKSADVYQSNTRSLILQTVAKLLAGGAALNYTTGVETPLMAALSTCDEDLLWTLLDFKADVNQCDGVEDMNALGLAILLNEVALVEMLLKHGGKVNAQCCGNLVPIQLAMNKKSAISSLLIQSGADVHLLRSISLDDKLFTSQSPLMVAILRNNVHLARLLLEHGEDVNQTFPDSLESPIHQAVRNSHVHMVDLLVQFGADLNKPNFERHTPVGLALLMDHPVSTEMAKRLVLCGASPNRRTRISFFQKTYTPLHIACFKGNFEFVRFLVEEVCGRMGYPPVETMQAPESSDVSIKDRYIVAQENVTTSFQERFFKLLPRNQSRWGATASDASAGTIATTTVSSAAPPSTSVSASGVDSSSNACSDTGSGSSFHTGGGLGSAASKTNCSDATPRVSSNSSIVSSKTDSDNGRVRCDGNGASRPDSGSSKNPAEPDSGVTDGASRTGSSNIKPESGLGGTGDVNVNPTSAQQSSTEAGPDSTAGQSSASSMINVEASRADNSEQGSSRDGNQGSRAGWMNHRITSYRVQVREDVYHCRSQVSSVPSNTSLEAESVEFHRERDASFHGVVSALSEPEDESEVKIVDPEMLLAETGTRFAQSESGTTCTDTDTVGPAKDGEDACTSQNTFVEHPGFCEKCHHKRLDHGAPSPRFVKSRSGSRSGEGGELRSMGADQTGDKSGGRKQSPSKRAERRRRASMGDVESSGGAAWGHTSVRDSLRRDHGSLQRAGEPSASSVMEPAKGCYSTAAEIGLRILNPPTTAWSPAVNLTASSSATATTPNCEDAASKDGTEGGVSATFAVTFPANTLASAADVISVVSSSVPPAPDEPIFQVEFGSPAYEIPDAAIKKWQDVFSSERKEGDGRGRASENEQRRRLEGDVDEDLRSHNVIRFLNQEGSDGSTALFMAVYDGNVQLVNYLLDHGANPFFSSHHGNFFHAAVLSQSVPLVRRALELGCAINQHNVFGNSPLTLVSRLDLPEACELLVTHGADMNSRDRYGETPLLASVYFGCEMNARTLIQHGAQLNLLDDNHTSAIYWAIFNNRQRTLKLLLMSGAHFTAYIFSQYPRNIRVMHNKDLLKFIHHYVQQVTLVLLSFSHAVEHPL
ncbi:hypothetical protein V1264_005770 [Littorina saxatilis]|uniref:Uncharacterized protein n=1 Tax=Littorina saxatilis TaxID=31220 RepID=A0AAN9B2T9_9CAEN